MAINDLNPRRTVWFSPNEPSNKYDIWLSRNAHLDENGEEVIDSNSQRDCDYIFKIYDCGKWNPIVGFNATAANKIDIVEGNTLNHPALFTGNNPNDLYDYGKTLGQLLSDPNFVENEDWDDVFNSPDYDWEGIFGGTGWFGGLVWETIEGGSGDYHLPWATTTTPGAILSDIHENNESEREAGAQVRFAPENLNLYDVTYGKRIPLHNLAVTGRQLIDTINYEQILHPDLPGITPGGSSTIDPSVLYRSFYNSPTILKGWIDDPLNAAAQKPRFELSGSRINENRGKIPMLRDDDWWETHGSGYTGDYDDDNSALTWVSPEDLFDGYQYELPLASLDERGGIKAGYHSINGLNRIFLAECKLNPLAPEAEHQYAAEALFVDVRDVKQALDDWYADNDSDEWDLNLKASYGIVVRKETFTDDDNNQIVSYTHSLSNYGQFTKERMYCRTKFYNQATPGVQNRDYSYNDTHGLEWISGIDIITDALNVTESTNGFLKCTDGYFSFDQTAGGESYPTLSSNSQSNVDYVVNGGGRKGTYLDYNGQWTVPPDTQYQVFSTSVNGLVPKPNLASSKLFLNSAGGWSAPQLSVDTFNGLNSGLVPQPVTSSARYFLDATGNWSTPGTGGGGSGSNFSITMAQSIQASGNYTISNQTIDNTQSGFNRILIDEWSYYNLDAGDSRDVSITFSDTHVSGNAIYIRVNTGGYQVSVNVGQTDIIDSNGIFNNHISTLSSNSSYLFTIQFGIIKVEIISTYKQSNDSEEQISGNGGN